MVKDKMMINFTWMANILWLWYQKSNFNLKISYHGLKNLFMTYYVKIMSLMTQLDQTRTAKDISTLR